MKTVSWLSVSHLIFPPSCLIRKILQLRLLLFIVTLLILLNVKQKLLVNNLGRGKVANRIRTKTYNEYCRRRAVDEMYWLIMQPWF